MTAAIGADAGSGYDAFGLHSPTLQRVVAWCGPACDVYFRTRSFGTDHIPAGGAAILVANHGGGLPIDAGLLCLDVVRTTGRVLRPLTDRFVPRIPVVGTQLARIGAVVGTRANVARLVHDGELLAVFPEGAHGIAKPRRERYRLLDWSVGHAELALRYRVPVVPVAIVGSEESWPMLGRLHGVHWFGIPFLPVPLVPVPLPVRHEIRYGAPILLHDELRGDPDDPDLVARAAARVRVELLELLRAAGAGHS